MDWAPIGTVAFVAFASGIIEILKNWDVITTEKSVRTANAILSMIWAVLLSVTYSWPEASGFIEATVQFLVAMLGAALSITGFYKMVIQPQTKKNWWV